MPVKAVFAPHLNRPVKLGRRRPPAAAVAALPLAHYGLYLTPPASCDYSGAAAPALRDVMQNDALGDCVIAGGYHVQGVWTGNSAALFHASPAQVLADYEAIGGYVPGNPGTDNGCDETQAFRYWSRHGFANGDRLVGVVQVNASDVRELKQALFLFENLYYGIELPDAWLDPVPGADGFVWSDVGPQNPDNGHCVVAYGYNGAGALIDTWGLYGTLTWAAHARYCAPAAGGACYALLSRELVRKATQKSPAGLNWQALVNDFRSLGGHPA